MNLALGIILGVVGGLVTEPDVGAMWASLIGLAILLLCLLGIGVILD